MHTSKAAQVLHDWALAEGLMSESPVPAVATPPELALVTPAMPDGIAMLRQKRILAVGFNEAAREVVAFTKNAAPTGKKALAALPNRVDDVKIVYRQGNNVSAGDNPLAPHGGPPFVVRNAGGNAFYTCGSSISVGNCVDAGTLGALVRNAAGELLGLSNNHVSGSCSHAEVGLPIVAPGLTDVAANSLHPFTIGLHHSALPMLIGTPSVVPIANNTDAAIFRIINAQQVSSYQGAAYDTPATSAPLTAGMTVEKVGRTTGHTTGQVVSQMYGPCSVNYGVSRYNFSGSIFFPTVYVIHGIGDVFSDSGDSGSLITAEVGGSRVAVGIVFAGGGDLKAPGQKLTLALPIEPILTGLGLTLVSGHNI